jgi:pentose-5-phosphate-3-epimerase
MKLINQKFIDESYNKIKKSKEVELKVDLKEIKVSVDNAANNPSLKDVYKSFSTK